VTVTVGATEAIYCAVQALVRAGDEAIVFDPAYDSYDPSVRLAGAKCVHVPLMPPSFRYDWKSRGGHINSRTRLIIINTPHNPACTVMSAADLDALAELIRGRNIYVLSDEVYEHVVYDGRGHVSVLTHPELRETSIAVFSFGKTLHATGLRVGYGIARPQLTRELRKVHQFNTFSIAHPLQRAIANYLVEKPDSWRGLPTSSRPSGIALRAGSRIRRSPCASRRHVFPAHRVQRHRERGGCHLRRTPVVEAGVATIPLSPFYQDPPPLSVLRLCIAKRDRTLDDAAARLQAFRERTE